VINSILIAGSGASIFDEQLLLQEVEKVSRLSSSDTRADILIDWENLSLIEKNRFDAFKILLILGGKWSPGRLKSIDGPLLSDLIHKNVINQVELIKILKKRGYLCGESSIIFISSLSALNTDYTAPEYSYSKALAEKVISDTCEMINVKRFEILRPSFIEDSNILRMSNNHFGHNLERDTISRQEFMTKLNDRIYEIFHCRS
jgi:short-subunit dehydrogenase involved in D-alanine esterification of teichoic acids